MTFSVQSELPPSHQLLLEHPGEGVFQGEGEELSSPAKEERRRAEIMRGSPREVSCPLPAACLRSPCYPMTRRNGKKSNHRPWKTWCRAQHAKPQQTGQEAICSIMASFCTETAAAARGDTEPTPNSPPTTAKSPGHTITLVIALSTNQMTLKSPG